MAACSTEDTFPPSGRSGVSALLAAGIPGGGTGTVRAARVATMKSDTCVQKTNDFSSLSKAAAAARGYFPDPFQRHFTSRVCRRSPLIHRGYCVRWRAVTHCVREFLEDTKESAQRQVLSLGCGFDSLYFRMRQEVAARSTAFWEVDFPAVVERKCRVIEETAELRDALRGEVHYGGAALLSQDYKLLGVDLSDIARLGSSLDGAGMSWDRPTLILGEVALCYMDAKRSTDVIGWAAHRFPHSRFILYEQFSPHDPFGRVMMSHFASLNSALRSVAEYPRLEDQERRFLKEGWQRCCTLDLNQFSFLCVAEEEAARLDTLEPFDEFEEFHLKCSHYFILAASCGTLTASPALRPLRHLPPDFSVSPARDRGRSLPVTPLPISVCGLARFGHRSCLISSGTIVTTGGFGDGNSKHQRLSDLHLLLEEGSAWAGAVIAGQWDGRLLHSLTPIGDGKALVLGGRLSPSHPACGAQLVQYEEATQTVTTTKTPRDLTPELQRWRHSATMVTLSGQRYVFVFGGRSVASAALQEDCLFLQPDELRWIQVPVSGEAPPRSHTHSSCGWKDGALLSGGLLQSGVPTASIYILHPQENHFQWRKLDTQPPLTPRYAHTSHVIGDKLVLVGGVWIHSRGVPGLTIVNLISGRVGEFQLHTESLEWPLMLHGHSSVLLPDPRQGIPHSHSSVLLPDPQQGIPQSHSSVTIPDPQRVMLLGGGGTCFSFGTHFNPQPVVLEVTLTTDIST